MHTIKKRGQFTSSTFLRHRQTPYYLKRVMPTPFSVNSSFVLGSVLSIGDFQKQESKSGYSSYMSYLYLSQPIGIYGFKSSTFV